MKKYLLTGGFAAALLLGACSGEESGDAESTEEETTEEVTEEETAEETTEDAEAAEEKTADQAEEEIEEVTESGVETIKEVEVGETTQLENVNMTVNMAQINRVEVNEDLAIFLDSYEAGEKVDNLVIEYTIENTTESPRAFYIDQAEVVTSTGQQLQPEFFLSDGIQADMQGAVSSTGTVPYIMDEGAGDEIEWVDVIVPAIMDEETYDVVSEEQKYRIEF
ncbi:hypothetical protein [Salinicoccus roseus]|uniref:hypothetical protein n=1 Tax=Salinicoccus roseus TaxID=45670 RepID=UPI001EF4F87F|nr:hypothetical protein [Salinicoccus roseus]MCG7332154.1 hypothetical protein [Salinicoccus roseus]